LEIARGRLPQARLVAGRGEKLPLESGSVDLALATGIMHHVDSPSAVIREMFRVAKKAVLISDHNNFAFGGPRARGLRLWLYSLRLLGFATYLKQGFRRQSYSEDDGWYFPYSLLNDYGLISSLSAEVDIIPTRPSSLREGNLLLAQSHMAILAVKAQP
jgi:SAM-dependent methyltransferase